METFASELLTSGLARLSGLEVFCALVENIGKNFVSSSEDDQDL